MRALPAALFFSLLTLAAAANAAPIADDPSDLTPGSVAPLIDTGITPPQALNSLDLYQPALDGQVSPEGRLVTVSFTVDKSGLPRNIRIVKGFDPFWDVRVVGAVEDLRYRPAMMNNKPIAMDMKLNINITP